MSDQDRHLPAPSRDAPIDAHLNGHGTGGYPSANGRDPDAEEDPFIDGRRLMRAMRSYWWVLLLSAVIGAAAAWIGYHGTRPVYEATGSLWINVDDSRGSELGGPIDQGRILSPATWLDLLRSQVVLEPVVMQEKLYIESEPGHAHLFAGFQPSDSVRHGAYRLEVAPDGSRWILHARDVPVDSGRTGTPVGARGGFHWTWQEGEIPPGHSVSFRLIPPSDAVNRLMRQLITNANRERNFVSLRLEGEDPDRIARVLQAVMERHVALAGELKREKLDELTTILEEQLDAVRRHLEETEQELESFRVATVTLPTDQSSPVAPGLEQTRSIVYSDFFEKRLELEALRQDKRRILDALRAEDGGKIRVEALELIPAVQASSQTKASLAELLAARAELRSLTARYTGDYQPVAELRERIRTLEGSTIPAQAQALLNELGARERELSSLLDTRASELSEIPRRSILEARLEREQEIAERFFVDLRQRHSAAELAAASSTEDVRILDRAEVPPAPVRDVRVRWATLAILGSLGIGLVGVLLLDRIHPRIRYLSELTRDMHFAVLGVVPRISSEAGGNSRTVIECFRDIRMRIEFAHGPTRPLLAAVTSPDEGEGKTLVTANVALAYARLGRKTLVIDADTRKGDLHELLQAERQPGLTELIQGAAWNDCVKTTQEKNLRVLPAGSRLATSPELLGSSGMQDVLAYAKQHFDVILLDCPPLAAGSDSFVLGALTGSVVLVMRSGSTDKGLAEGKLDLFLPLPVRILGAILNDVDKEGSGGQYEYYSYYLSEYAAGAEEADGDVEERKMLALHRTVR